jgi:hypothetical protein
VVLAARRTCTLIRPNRRCSSYVRGKRIIRNNFMVLKVAPALVINESQLDGFVDAIESIVDLMHASTGFWTEALGMARRVINVI